MLKYRHNRRELARRLRPVCADWPNDLFDSMIEGLATLTMKYEGTASPSTYDRRTTERLVSEVRNALTRNADVGDERPETD